MRIWRGVRKFTVFEEFQVAEEDEIKAREAVENDDADALTIFKKFNESYEIIEMEEVKV